jgi:protein TonB
MIETQSQNEGEFEAMLAGVLAERSGAGAAPEGLTQRLLARVMQVAEAFERQQAERSPRFAFAESVRVRRSGASLWTAIAAHAGVLAVVLLVLGRTAVSDLVRKPALSVTEISMPPQPPVMPRADAIGGGGGHPDSAPASQGKLPKIADRQIEAPTAPPTVVMQKDLRMADNTLPNLGVPESRLAGSSLGNGAGTGIGSGNGAGVGPGTGGNIGGGVMHAGGSISKPVVLYAVEPEFSEEARKSKFSGNVEVYLIVDEQGRPSHVRVVRGVGMGLDEKAVAAVEQYRFKPAMQNGRPVKVDLYIDVEFRIF